jgi:hypothetical protein
MRNTKLIEEGSNTSPLRAPELSFSVPRESLLDGFAQLSDSPEGLDVRGLRARDQIVLLTQHTEYRIVLLDPAEGRVLVQGGDFFVEPTEAIISGTTAGGALLKVGWIVPGLKLEFLYRPAQAQSPQSVITSLVTSFYLTSEALPKTNPMNGISGG